MAKKKSDGKVDRTQIYVALIGVIGTIVVTLITVLANRPAATTPTATPETNETSATPTEPASQNSGLCLENYFADVDAANRVALQLGVSQRITFKKDAVYGAQLLDGSRMLGEMKFTGDGNSKSFKIISVVDARCAPIFDFGNLDRPIANNTVADWENLGITLDAQEYRMRMGWYSGNQIEVIFTEN